MLFKKWDWKYGYHGFRRHQSNRKLFTIDFDKNDEYDDYSLDYFSLCFTQDIRSGVTLLIVFPIIIIFMIVLGYAAQSKADKQYAAFQMLSNHFIDSLRGIDTLKLFGLSKNMLGVFTIQVNDSEKRP